VALKLGIMVTTDRHLDQVVGIARAAQRKGHAVTIFATDKGARLLADPRFARLSALPGVEMSFCDHSARIHGGRPAGLPEEIVSGSQFENATMASESDRVLVL
jgi:predicted peroxiredoxin